MKVNDCLFQDLLLALGVIVHYDTGYRSLAISGLYAAIKRALDEFDDENMRTHYQKILDGLMEFHAEEKKVDKY